MSTPSAVTDISLDEMVVLYPSVAARNPNGDGWRVTVTGTVLHPGSTRFSHRFLVRMLRRWMKVPAEALQSNIFKQRILDFAAKTFRGKQIAISFGSHTFELDSRTRSNGLFQGSCHLNESVIAELRDSGQIRDGWIHYRVALPEGDTRRFEGRDQLLKDTGTSVISDIDDTIKNTEVLSRHKLLKNTFLNEFESIPGMARVYREWESAGVAFHYVSASPWQLYRALAELFSQQGFPAGSFHLRSFAMGEQVIRRMLPVRRATKRSSIESLFRTFPNRKFALIGDSGEQDPEIYAAMARRFPRQVIGIYIRQMANRPLTPLRAERVFGGGPVELCRVFQAADELRELMPIQQ